MLNSSQINSKAINSSAGDPLVKVTRLHTSGLAMLAENPVLVAASTGWHVPVMVAHKSGLVYHVSVVHTSKYDILSVVSADHKSGMALDEYNTVEASFDNPAPFSVEAAWQLVLGLEKLVEVAFTQRAGLTTAVERAWNLDSDLALVVDVERGWSLDAELTDSTPIIISNTISVTKDGEVIELSDSSTISINEGDYAWKGQLVLARSSDADKFGYNDALTIDFFGTTYNMLVDSKGVGRQGVGRINARVSVIGTGAMYASPRAPVSSVKFDADSSAKLVVESLVGAVDWRIADWIIPANRIAPDDAVPMTTAQRVVEAAGAVLEANPDGSFYVRYRYPVAVAEYDNASPEVTIYEADTVVGVDQPYLYFEKANKLRISDIAAANFADRIEYVPDGGDNLNGTLRVFPAPWRDVHLRHTGPASILLSELGESLIEIEEQVEIIDGRGEVNYPIVDIASVEWSGAGLGALIFVVGSSSVETAENDGCAGLAVISYTTKAKRWDCGSPIADDIQFLVEDGA